MKDTAYCMEETGDTYEVGYQLTTRGATWHVEQPGRLVPHGTRDVFID